MIPSARSIKNIHFSAFDGSRSLRSRWNTHASHFRFLQKGLQMPSGNAHCTEYCSFPYSGRSGQEQPTVRTTSDWSRGRFRPDGWLSCNCSAQLFLSGSVKIGETAIYSTPKPRNGQQRASSRQCQHCLSALSRRLAISPSRPSVGPFTRPGDHAHTYCRMYERFSACRYLGEK